MQSNTESSATRVAGMIARGDYDAALGMLNTLRREPSNLDLIGVCLMRSGRPREALEVYRGFALNARDNSERPGLSAEVKLNFATSLLLCGLPAGCLDVLREGALEQHPYARQLQAAISDWARSLGFLRRWDWRLNKIVAADTKIPLAFTPGVMPSDASQGELAQPSGGSASGGSATGGSPSGGPRPGPRRAA